MLLSDECYRFPKLKGKWSKRSKSVKWGHYLSNNLYGPKSEGLANVTNHGIVSRVAQNVFTLGIPGYTVERGNKSLV